MTSVSAPVKEATMTANPKNTRVQSRLCAGE
jgi:hypothetical protein